VSVTVVLSIGGLVWIGHALAVTDPLERSDVIVAISGDRGPRVIAAVDLWKRGYAPTIVFSGAALDPESVSSAELMKRQAVAAGVPEDRILVEPRAVTTEENAARVADLMSARGFGSAILVTSPYHQRRAALHFAREFQRYGLTFRNHPASDPEWDPDTWWTQERSRELTVVELVKIAAESLGGRLKPAALFAGR
jgi:uncharacterized SAM-binding protein YcdF (DUF218 family)